MDCSKVPNTHYLPDKDECVCNTGFIRAAGTDGCLEDVNKCTENHMYKDSTGNC